MSPIAQGIKDPDNNEWEWVHIEDFSAGVYDASNISTSSPVVEAPLGAATATGTWCCMALPGGGLGPLPRLAQVQDAPTLFPTDTFTLWIVGALMVPDAGGGAAQLLFMIEMETQTLSPTHFYRVYAFDPTTTAFNLVLQTTSAHMAGIFGSPYPQVTRARASTFTEAGTPIAVWPSNVDTTPTDISGHVYVYPTPTTRTAYSVKDLVTPGTQITGQIACFYNRIIVLSGIPYAWPGGPLVTNENIAFTTPPNSYTLGNQQTVFAAENPFGYGAWGSISTGELLFVKKQGGGVVVNGDVEFPTSVLNLPGIHPTGDLYGRTASSELGCYYCSDHQGAWLWNGGNTSQKISAQLRDDFFDVQTDVIASNNYGFYAERWGQWIMFSGNWLYNEQQGSWWVLYPPGGGGDTATPGKTFFWWLPGAAGYNFYALPLRLTSTTPQPFLYRFDNRYSAEHYQWTSLPIHVTPTANHVVDVREVVVRASCPSVGTGGGQSTVTVTVGGWSGQSHPGDIVQEPSILRFHVGMGGLGLDDIYLQLNGDWDNETTTNQAPIIHSVDIAYAIRAHEQAQN